MDLEIKKIKLEQGGKGAKEDLRSAVSSKKKLPMRTKILFLIIVLFFFGSFIWSFFTSSTSVFKYAFPGVQGPQVKSTDDRVNILLLGNAGGTHDGPELTDSIIIASYNLKTHKVLLISVPRDLWLEGIKEKVNAAYEVGKQQNGDGLTFAEDKIDDILGVPIHYGIRLDFSGFAKAIDLVDGVDIEVPKTFDDYNYPVEGKEDDLCGLVEKIVDLPDDQAAILKLKPVTSEQGVKKYKVFTDSNNKIATNSADFSCRYEHIHFDKGKTHMDGTTALKFVRSRMGTNGEGSDFARSLRQQLVIQAFREKALSLQTIFNPQKVSGLISTFGKSVETDIPKDLSLEFYNLVKNMDGTENLVLGDLGEGKSVFEVGPVSEYGAYVLIPPGNDFSSVKDFLKKKLDGLSQTPKPDSTKK